MFGVKIYDWAIVAVCVIIGVLIKVLIDSFKKSHNVKRSLAKEDFDVSNPINGKLHPKVGDNYTDEYGITWSRMIPLNTEEK